MPDNTYKIIELVGSSSDGIEAAIKNAISQANESIQNLDWFEVREVRGNIADGQPEWFQVKLGIGFRVLSAAELGKD